MIKKNSNIMMHWTADNAHVFCEKTAKNMHIVGSLAVKRSAASDHCVRNLDS